MKSTESEVYLFNEDDKIIKEEKKQKNFFYSFKNSIVGDQIVPLKDIIHQKRRKAM